MRGLMILALMLFAVTVPLMGVAHADLKSLRALCRLELVDESNDRVPGGHAGPG